MTNVPRRFAVPPTLVDHVLSGIAISAGTTKTAITRGRGGHLRSERRFCVGVATHRNPKLQQSHAELARGRRFVATSHAELRFPPGRGRAGQIETRIKRNANFFRPWARRGRRLATPPPSRELLCGARNPNSIKFAGPLAQGVLDPA